MTHDDDSRYAKHLDYLGSLLLLQFRSIRFIVDLDRAVSTLEFVIISTFNHLEVVMHLLFREGIIVAINCDNVDGRYRSINRFNTDDYDVHPS